MVVRNMPVLVVSGMVAAFTEVSILPDKPEGIIIETMMQVLITQFSSFFMDPSNDLKENLLISRDSVYPRRPTK